VAPSKHPIEDATLKDIECIDEDKHETLMLVQFGKRGGSEHRTKIKTILGHSITHLPVPVLKKFCINNNIFDENGSRLRRSPKHVICDRIMWYLENENEAEKIVQKTRTKSTSISKLVEGEKTELPVNRIECLVEQI
jgi:hypothetical protein